MLVSSMVSIFFLGINDIKLSSDAAILETLQTIASDPVLGLVPNSPGQLKQTFARSLLNQQWKHGPLHYAAENVVHTLFKALLDGGAQKFSCTSTLNMLTTLSTARVQLRPVFLKALHKAGVNDVNENTANTTLQHIIELLLPLLSRHLYQLKSSQDPTSTCADVNISGDTPVDLSKDDKQILHFAIGYTVLKLKRKFQRCSTNNKAAQLYLDVVKSWTADKENSSLTQEVQEWTCSMDRGGLIHCSAEFFQLMKVVEVNLRTHLNTKTIALYAGENIVPIIVGKLKATAPVLDAFRQLVGHQLDSEDLCEGLLDEVLVAWVHCRARRVVENYIFELKAQKKVFSRKGTPAMRKTLDKQSH